MSNFKRLDWDSGFFGYEIAKMSVDKSFQEESLRYLEFTLIYVLSNRKLKHTKLFYADTKVEFVKHYLNYSNVSITKFNSVEHSFEELLKLVYFSGIHSRFNTDPNFKNNEFLNLYKYWIESSINNDNTIILVKQINSRMEGFILISLHIDFGRVELIAVSEKHQNKGIGSELLKAAENICLQNNKVKLKVATQGKNHTAKALYQRFGFELEEVTHIYHYWKK
jgi:dTDP-4-amino-4,6-dideoxy-D-galactose acyltransferase